MTNASIARLTRPMSARKANLEAKRRSYLMGELSKMGRHGWHHYSFRDWQPLEAELRTLSRSPR